MTTDGKSLNADIAVIGAGVAGLAAARELQVRGERFILLEASHRIGGRAYTEFLEPEVPFDLGAHWIHSDEINPFAQIAQNFGAVLKTEQEHYVSGDYFEDDHWLPESSRDEFLNYFEEQFRRISESANDRGDRAVMEVIDNDNRWAPYFYQGRVACQQGHSYGFDRRAGSPANPVFAGIARLEAWRHSRFADGQLHAGRAGSRGIDSERAAR